jgi:hypothetical protein
MRALLSLAFVATMAASDGCVTSITASAALAAAEKLCALPKGAEFVTWAVISSDEEGNPSPVARSGRYWVVHGRFNLPNSETPVDVLFPVPKTGEVPKRCSLVPAPEIER